MTRKMEYDVISFKEQSVIRKKGSAIKERLRDNMMITVDIPVLSRGKNKSEAYMMPGMMGIVKLKSSPKEKYDPDSQDPNERRSTECIIEFMDPETGKTHTCSPNYNNIVILPKKKIPQSLKEAVDAKRRYGNIER